MKSFFSYIFLVFCLSKILVLFSGCASIIPPSGGPRDSIPPVLITVVPKEEALNVSGMKILFTFDEYLELKEVRSNLIVSPVPKSDPLVESHLKTITVTLKDTLKPNTTYTLDFGKSIRDINEGNILRNFRYTFSTGSYIDSMELGGRVILAETGKVDSTLIVMLHKSLLDSSVYYDLPRYITRLDTGGYFNFRNIAPGSYAIYALKDEGQSHRYTSKSALFAFADSPVLVLRNNPAISLYAYSDTAGSPPPKKTAAVPKPKKSEVKEHLSFRINMANGQFGLLDTLQIQFQTPLKSFDSSLFRLTDEKFQEIAQPRIVEDSAKKKLTLFYHWPPETRYHLIANKDFAEDTLGLKLLKTDTISFQTKREADYGSLLLHFRNLDLSRHPVLLFFQKDGIKRSLVIRGNQFRYALFEPGEYELRVLYDNNQNGIWDPGDFFGRHIQPEKVVLLSRKPLNVKAGWDNESDINF
jgi:hypothetical protein